MGGNPAAQFNLAHAYEHGTGVMRNFREARRLYAMALARGAAPAAHALKRVEEKMANRSLVQDVTGLTDFLWRGESVSSWLNEWSSEGRRRLGGRHRATL